MVFVNSYITAGIAVAVLVTVLFIVYYWHRIFVSNRRIYRMMLTCGIDEDTAKYADQRLDIDMAGVRRRCRVCPVPETCDRWLNGEAVPNNHFCPNVWHFASAVRPERTRLRYNPAHRPGRRLDA
jgi:hypothetical protein